jgi:hypothetical protein
VPADRRTDLERFYGILADLEERLGGRPSLGECHGRMRWPERGVYFLFEEGERRWDSGGDLRVVRVGTHSLKQGSRTTLWTRLVKHRGVKKTGAGNHRSSSFRALVGAAILEADPALECPTWGRRASNPHEVRCAERAHETRVSRRIGSMRLLVVAIDDPPGPGSARDYVARNAIALLSNFDRPLLDPPSEGWLGLKSPRERVRRSGLWNSDHVTALHDPAFLAHLEQLARAIGPIRR